MTWRAGWLAVAIMIAVFIFVQSSEPSPSVSNPPLSLIFGASKTDGTHFWNDAAHVVAHLALYCALAYTLQRATGSTSWPASLSALFIALAYGVSDELHQSFVASRDASLFDLGVDAVGTMVGSTLPLLSTPWSGGRWRVPR